MSRWHDGRCSPRDNKKVAVTMPGWMRDMVEREARASEMSMSALVRTAIRWYFSDLRLDAIYEQEDEYMNDLLEPGR